MSDDRNQESVARRPVRRRSFLGRWFRRLPLLIGLLSVLIWLLPALLSTAPIRSFVLDVAGSKLPEGMSVGSATLSWTKPIQLNDVSIEDQSGREVLHVDRIESEETLWELATERLSKGLFHVFRPRLTLTIRERSTAIDPAVLKMLQSRPAGPRGKARSNYSIDLSNGEVALVNEAGTLLTEITDVTVSFHNPSADGEPGRLELTGKITQPDAGGTLVVSAEWSGSTAADRRGSVHAELVRVPVDALNPRLRSQLPGRRLSGELTCTLDADWSPGDAGGVLANLDWQAALIELQLIPEEGDEAPSNWSLADSSLKAAAEFGDDGTIRLDQLNIHSQPLQADVSGTIARGESGLRVDLQGDLVSEPDLILEFLGEAARRNVAIDGLSARSLSVSGPLTLSAPASTGNAARGSTPESLLVHADIGWTLLDVAGMQSPNGLLTAHWHDGQIVFVPTSVQISGGQVQALPRVDLTSEPRMLVIDPGPLADDVQFTPEMCRGWLKFVSPLMADAAAVSGRFSLASQGASFPLDDMAEGEFQGILAVQSAQVGPGPLARQTIGIVRQVETLLKGGLPLPGRRGRNNNRNWLVLDEQNIQFRVAEGRVHHDRIEYRTGETIVATSGSVGFDESLDIILEVPLQEKWLGRLGPLASLKGEVLRLPVRGTMSEPIIDLQPLAELNRRIATGAADGLLRRLLGQ